MAAFLFAPWPREVVALAGAGVLLISRRMASREMLSLVDWHLLILFVGLFVVNAAIAQSGFAERPADDACAGRRRSHQPVAVCSARARCSRTSCRTCRR